MTRNQNKWLGRVVGGILILIGLVMFGGVVVPSLFGWWKLRDGVVVDVTIERLELGSVAGARQHVPVHLRYAYEYESELYEGERVSQLGYDDDFYGVLRDARERDGGIQVVVDPDDPGFSAYDRDFHWWPLGAAMIFITGFVGIGSYVLAFGGHEN